MICFACVCGRQLQAREEDEGRKAKCPSCGAMTTVPATEDASPPPEHAIQADAPIRSSREDRREEREDRPKRRRNREVVPGATSGKATAAMVLGISSLFLFLTAIPGVIFGILALRDIGKSDDELGGKGMAITGLVLSCVSFVLILPVVLMIGLLIPAVGSVRSAAERMQDANNLRQMGIAMLNHESAYTAFPEAAAYQDANGKPLLSWRVALLPFIEQDNLYKRFRLDEPWDSPTNKALLPLMPKVYALPNDPNPGSGMTYYQVFVGAGSAFEPRKRGPNDGPPVPGQVRLGWNLSDFPDGLSNTFLIATSATAVPWTKPDDLPFSPTGPVPQLGGQMRQGSNMAFADGSVRLIPPNVSDETLRAGVTRNGGEGVTFP